MGKMLQSTIDVNRNLLQWFAVATMFLDHLCVFFFPDVHFFRVIGRIAAPVYMLLFIQSFDKTSYRPEFLLRVLFLGLLSQVFFAVLLPGKLNMILSMFVCLTPFVLLRRGHFYLSMISVIFLSFLPLDYPGWFIFFSFLAFCGRSTFKIAISFIILSIIFSVFTRSDLSFYHVLFLPLLFISPSLSVTPISGKLWRWFYPAHFAFIVIIRFCLNYFNT